jgi:dimeric dUTPase (all-alpha-NTP-PPase superfamily)
MTEDKLNLMLKMQRTLQENAYGYNFSKLTPQERTAFIKEMSIHVNQELNEMLYELPYFKPWKDYSGMTDEEIRQAYVKAGGELVDLAHFFLNLVIGLDMTADELFTGYYNKNKENYQRQVEGYTHDKSYR